MDIRQIKNQINPLTVPKRRLLKNSDFHPKMSSLLFMQSMTPALALVIRSNVQMMDGVPIGGTGTFEACS